MEIAEEKYSRVNHLKVLSTMITTTNDLFVLIQVGKTYTVFLYDLDSCNIFEIRKPMKNNF